MRSAGADKTKQRENALLMNVQVNKAMMYASVRHTSATLRVYDVQTFSRTAHLRTMTRYELTMARGKRLRCEVGYGAVLWISVCVLPLLLDCMHLQYKRLASRRTVSKKIKDSSRYQI